MRPSVASRIAIELLLVENGSPLERLFRAVAYLGVLATAAAVLGLAAGAPELASSFELSGGAAAGAALLAAVAARARTERRTDPKGERRVRFWRGAPGRWLFGLARIGLPGADESSITVTPEVTG